MATSEEIRVLEEQKARKKIVRDAKHQCPHCLVAGLQPMGGFNSVWFECLCGAYSPLSATYDAALANTLEWKSADDGKDET